MATEPAPPVRELPDDYAQDVDRLTSKYRLPDDLEPEMRAIERELSDFMGGGITVCDVLRTAIRTALAEQDAALRLAEESLIDAAVQFVREPESLLFLTELRGRVLDYREAKWGPLPGADDLRPRGEDVLDSAQR